MGWKFDIAPRDALAAPTSTNQTYVLSVVIAIVSILSALGAGWIILSFACFKSLRSFRHQLILGLAISDCVMALNFLSSAAMNMNGRFIGAPEQQGFCSFNGFMTQVFVIQTDYWVLVIAICTYVILADHKRAAGWVQDHRIFLSCLPWFFSVAWAAVGLGVAGYGNIGAWCWFTSDEVRLLVNFIPRWIIIVSMLLLYARLYFVLFRAHRFISSPDEESSTYPTSGSRSRTMDQPPPANLGGAYAGRAPRVSRKLKKLARLMLMYPIAYMLIWALPTSVRIYQVATGRPAPFALQTVDKACIVVQGLIDAIIYGANESSLSSWRALLFPAPFPTIDAVSASPTAMLESTAGKKRTVSRSIPSSRLSDLDDDSASSFNVTMSSPAGAPQNDSTARIDATGSSAGWRSDEEVEMSRLGKSADKRCSGSGIRKTVEVNVFHEDAQRVEIPPPVKRFSRTREGSTFFEN